MNALTRSKAGEEFIYSICSRRTYFTPGIIATSPRETKIFWNAPFLGPNFDIDNHRVCTYLAHQCLETQSTNNSQGALLVLSLFYRGSTENTKKVVVARAALDQLRWSNEGIFNLMTMQLN